MPKSGNPPPAWVIEVKTEGDIAGMRAAGKVARCVRGRSIGVRTCRAVLHASTRTCLTTLSTMGSRCTRQLLAMCRVPPILRFFHTSES